jgi:hypothetical protein
VGEIRVAFLLEEKTLMRPNSDQIKRASKDVAWEYVTLLGAALEMAKGSKAPLNHLVQEAFLVHVRNMAEFFREGVTEFEKNNAPPDRAGYIYAVDFCDSVGWQWKPFDGGSKLIKVINQSLSHMTYGRDSNVAGHIHFEGREHVHGIVKLMRNTWGDFLKSVKPQFLQPQYREDIRYWLVEHTKEWSVTFGNLESNFEEAVKRQTGWTLNLYTRRTGGLTNTDRMKCHGTPASTRFWVL